MLKKSFKSLLPMAAIADAIGPYNKQINYGGTGWNSGLIPRLLLWCVDVNIAFYIHDGLYELWGGSNDDLAQEKADLLFLMIMMYCISKHDFVYGTRWFMRRACQRQALIYYNTVRDLGASAFEAAGPKKQEA